jgi:hypothetical protein
MRMMHLATTLSLRLSSLFPLCGHRTTLVPSGNGKAEFFLNLSEFCEASRNSSVNPIDKTSPGGFSPRQKLGN